MNDSVIAQAKTEPARDTIWPSRHSVLLWVIYFCYAVTAALLLQKMVLPMLPSLHGGYGLLKNDAILFHREAIALAEEIRNRGWDAWSLWPGREGSGNVAILAAMYVLFGPDPALLIPINAALHALGGLLLFLIGRQLWPGRVGVYGSLVASALFVLFPSSLVWYGQVHKDSFSNAGLLLMVYAFLRALSSERSDVWVAPCCALSAVLLIALVRPYYFKFLTIAGFAVLPTIVMFVALGRQSRRMLPVFGIAAILAVTAMSIRSGHANLDGTAYATGGSWIENYVWNRSAVVPVSLDRQAELAARTRVGLTRYNQSVGARSLIDGHVELHSFTDIVLFAPRALQVALFAPFPSTWMQESSLPVVLGIGETIVWYLFVPGILIAIYRRWSAEVVITLVFSLTFLMMIGIVEPNVGTIFRMRYVHLNLLLLVGALGWMSVWLERTTPVPNKPVAHRHVDA